VRVIQKHGQAAVLRHYVPAGAVIGGGVLSLLSPVFAWASLLLATLATLYAGAIVAASLRLFANSKEWDLLPAMPIVFVSYHVGFGLGFCRGLVDFVLLRRAPATSAVRLTR
jgi:hypothetical protein